MNKVSKTIVGVSLLVLLFVLSCQKKESNKLDSVIEGKASIYVDESILPIVEDEQAVFETEYKAKLNLVPKSENEIVNTLLTDTVKIAVLTRSLTSKEISAFKSKKRFPKITPFAYDAVALIRNKTEKDSLVVLQDVIDFINGKTVSTIKGLVFDNANSSTVRYFSEISGVSLANQPKIFSLKSNEEVIKYVAEHNGMIGIVGINWIFQPPIELQESVDKVSVLAVKGKNSKEFVFPTQDNLAKGNYPLARHLYIINCQGYSGLGMGFASFLGGERGQRIILKSGLLPENTPGRKILIRNQILKDKN